MTVGTLLFSNCFLISVKTSNTLKRDLSYYSHDYSMIIAFSKEDIPALNKDKIRKKKYKGDLSFLIKKGECPALQLSLLQSLGRILANKCSRPLIQVDLRHLGGNYWRESFHRIYEEHLKIICYGRIKFSAALRVIKPSSSFYGYTFQVPIRFMSRLC